MRRIILSLLALSACTTVSTADPIGGADPTGLDWLSGCWQSESGDAREVWSGSEDGYYFGYAVTLQEGQVVFFEQMRIDPGAQPVFNAYPAGQGPSAFPAMEQTAQSITFANDQHDYPQKIRYTRSGNALNAVISLIDDSRPGTFDYVRCNGD